MNDRKEFTLNEVAKMVGVSHWRLYRHHYEGRLPEPRKVGRTRCYTPKDVARVRQHFGKG